MSLVNSERKQSLRFRSFSVIRLYVGFHMGPIEIGPLMVLILWCYVLV